MVYNKNIETKRERSNMKAWAYNNLVKEYKKREGTIKVIESALTRKDMPAWSRANTLKELAKQKSISANIKSSIKSAVIEK